LQRSKPNRSWQSFEQHSLDQAHVAPDSLHAMHVPLREEHFVFGATHFDPGQQRPPR
jgi:hypothetical protein